MHAVVSSIIFVPSNLNTRNDNIVRQFENNKSYNEKTTKHDRIEYI